MYMNMSKSNALAASEAICYQFLFNDSRVYADFPSLNMISDVIIPLFQSKNIMFISRSIL
jgi:hypothetical protein